MPDATITSTASTFGTISGTFAADQSTVTGTISGTVTGTLTGSVGVPGPAGPGVPAGGTAGQYLQKIDGVDYNTDWVTLNLSAYAPLNSPVFTGDPQAPTPTFGDNDTSIATTAFVQAGLLGGTANAKNLEVYVRNQSGSTIPAGSIVYISGATGNRPLITLAQANNDANSAQTMGFTKTSIANNGFGYVIVRGELENIDTSALTEGAQLYLSPTTAGTWTTTKPSAPQHLVYVGIVVRAHPTLGVILVAVQNGYELNELHDVAITSPTNGQVLKYNSSTNLWVNGTDSSGVAWGAITGTLSSQTDLQTALDGKYSTSNPAGYITSSALTGYATESWVTAGFYPLTGNPSGFITSSALTPYLTSATAASTYQTIAGMSSYLTTSAAASTYYPLTGNPSGFITSSALTAYAPLAGATFTGKVNFKAGTTSSASVNLAPGVAPTSPSTGDVWFDSSSSKVVFRSSALTQNIASEVWVTSQGYLTSASLSGYATESWVTSNFYPLSGNPSNFATESWVTSYGFLTDAPSDGNQYVRLNGSWSTLSVPADYITSVSSPLSVTAGDLSIDLSAYLTTSTAASTYQTQAAMSAYLTSASAATTYAPIASPALTGNPTAPTPATSDNDTSIATTAFVKAQGYLTTAPVTSVAGKTGAVTLDVADVSGAAPLASPGLTGTPTAPTAAVDTNTTQLATTAYVVGQGYLKSATASSTYAPLASPSLTGTPTAPTATTGTNTTQIATTAFVQQEVPAASTTSAGKIELATVDEALRPASSTLGMTPETTREMLMYPGYINIFGGGNVATSGTGAASTFTFGSQRWHAMRSPNATIAGYGMYIFDYSFSGIGMAAMTRGVSSHARKWNNKIWLSGRTVLGQFAETTSGLNGDANCTARVMLGGRSSAGTGGMQSSDAGIGWRVAGGGSAALVMTVSTGSVLTETTSSFTPTLGQVFDWKMYSDGTGNVTLWVNDSQVATSTGGPTTSTAETTNFYCEVVEQTASATAPFGMGNFGTKVFWSQA